MRLIVGAGGFFEEHLRRLANGNLTFAGGVETPLARQLEQAQDVVSLIDPTRDPDLADKLARELTSAMVAAGRRRLTHLASAAPLGSEPAPAPGSRLDERSPLRPRGRLARAHAALEQRLRAEPRLEVVIVRAAQVLDPDEPTVGALLSELESGRAILPRGGRAPRSFIAASDLARLVLAAADRGQPGQVYLGSGFDSSWREVASLVNPQARLSYLPALFAPFAALAGLPGGRWLDNPRAASLALPQVLDNGYTRRELTWSPLVTSAAEWVAFERRGAAPRA